MHNMGIKKHFCPYGYPNRLILAPQLQYDAEISSILAFEASDHKQSGFVHHFLVSTSLGPISWFLNHLHDVETFYNSILCHFQSLCDLFWLWNESPLNNASIWSGLAAGFFIFQLKIQTPCPLQEFSSWADIFNKEKIYDPDKNHLIFVRGSWMSPNLWPGTCSVFIQLPIATGAIFRKTVGSNVQHVVSIPT